MKIIYTYTHTFVTFPFRDQATKFIRPWQMAASSDRKALGTVNGAGRGLGDSWTEGFFNSHPKKSILYNLGPLLYSSEQQYQQTDPCNLHPDYTIPILHCDTLMYQRNINPILGWNRFKEYQSLECFVVTTKTKRVFHGYNKWICEDCASYMLFNYWNWLPFHFSGFSILLNPVD